MQKYKSYMDLKAFTIVVACIIILGGLVLSYSSNQIMYEDSYSEAILQGHLLVAKQSVLQIEYALQYGKDIRNFYNMKNMMNQIMESLPGVNDIEIYGLNRELIYDGFEDRKNNDVDNIFTKFNEREVNYISDDIYYTLLIPISEKDGSIIAKMVINIEKKVIDDDVGLYINQLGIQFYLFSIGGIILVILLLGRMKFDFTFQRNKRSFMLMLILVSVIIIIAFNSYILISTSNSLINSFEKIGDWICSIIQNDINRILNKGVSIDKINDLNGWLEQISSQVPEIDNLFIDSDNKVQAVMSKVFINKQINNMIINGFIIGIVCIFIQIIFAKWIFKLQRTIYKDVKMKEGINDENERLDKANYFNHVF